MARKSAFRRRRRTGTRKGGRRRVHFSRKARSRINRRRTGGRKSRRGRRRNHRGGGILDDLYGLFGNHYDDRRRMRAYERWGGLPVGRGQNFVDAFNAARDMGGRMIGSAGDFLGRLRDQMTGRFSEGEADRLIGEARQWGGPVPVPYDAGAAGDFAPGTNMGVASGFAPGTDMGEADDFVPGVQGQGPEFL